MTPEPTLEIDGRLLVFGGPYSNLQATEALLAEARRLGLGPERLLCTGDLVAYCAEPQATIDLVRETGCAVVQGNCEESLGADAEDCGCGFDEATLCSLLSQQWYSFSRERVSAEAKGWMAGLPTRIAVRLGGRRLLAIHGGVEVINRFIFPGSPPGDKAEELAAAGADGVLAGHSGIPFAELIGDRLWLNSGALGMPANDGTPRVWYALIEATGAGLRIELKALDYDHAGAARRMAEEGLVNGYAACLENGLWPSLDVLTPDDRAATGLPLAERSLVWS